MSKPKYVFFNGNHYVYVYKGSEWEKRAKRLYKIFHGTIRLKWKKMPLTSRTRWVRFAYMLGYDYVPGR